MEGEEEPIVAAKRTHSRKKKKKCQSSKIKAQCRISRRSPSIGKPIYKRRKQKTLLASCAPVFLPLLVILVIDQQRYHFKPRQTHTHTRYHDLLVIGKRTQITAQKCAPINSGPYMLARVDTSAERIGFQEPTTK